jgi:hypothetical protein
MSAVASAADPGAALNRILRVSALKVRLRRSPPG